MYSFRNIVCLAVLLSAGLLVFSKPAFSFSMVDQDENQVIHNTFEDENKDGKADGDLALISLFRIQREKLRLVYTFQLKEFLTQEPTNLKSSLKSGDLFTIYGTPMNPYANLVIEDSGNSYVAFLKKNKHKAYTLMSMKIAPVKPLLDEHGRETSMVLNPWARQSKASSQTLQATSEVGPLEKESLSSLSERLRGKIANRRKTQQTQKTSR